MNKEFIPYEQALALKELGFDEPCLIKDTEQGEECAVYYVHQNGRPTFSQVFRWFREKHKLEAYSIPTKTLEKGWFQWNIYGHNWHEPAKTYEEAELSCLKKLIEIAKSKSA